MKSLTIIGGGLAGLSLGCALLQRKLPVAIYESGEYPRHRVCGEYIRGVEPATLKALGIEREFADAATLADLQCFWRDRPFLRKSLRNRAWGLSRYMLDERLCRRFTSLGGDLYTNQRIESGNGSSSSYVHNSAQSEGILWACGRRKQKSQWLGLKMHVQHMPLHRDLELHLGDHAYVGICPIEHGRINVCGLFSKRPSIRARKPDLFIRYLEQCGLGKLAERLQAAEPDPISYAAVSGFSCERAPKSMEAASIGDHYSMIPPFTGNGMSMAFESAAMAVQPIMQWANGDASWEQANRQLQRKIHRHFRNRLALARWAHRYFYHPKYQPLFYVAAKTRMLPFQLLTNWTQGGTATWKIPKKVSG